MKTNFTLNSKKLLLAIVTSFFITLSSKSVAQTITSTTSGGLWSSASTWIGGVVPTSTNDVVINGTVFINNSVSCRNITINAGDTLVDYNTSAVLTVLGNITNNGVVGRNVSNYYNEIDVKGNIENNGIWKPYKTTLSGVNMQFLQQSAGKRFEGVWAITDTNSFVKLNSNVVFGGNENFDLNNDTLHTNGYNLQVDEMGFYDGTIISDDTIYIKNKTKIWSYVSFIGNIKLTGVFNYSDGNVFIGTLTNQDTLINRVNNVLTVKGNIINNGYVLRDPSNYYNEIDVKGNIENNGIWKPYKTTLSGVSMQFLQQSAGKQFEGVWAITDTNSYVKLNSNVVFGGNENFDLNNDTLHTNGYNLQVDEMGFYDGTIISDDTIYIKNKTKIWSNVSFIGNIKLTGVFNYSDGNVFIGTLTNQDTLINRVNNVLTVKGNIINNGYVLRDPSNYYNEIDVKGNIENNGIWKPYKTTLSGVSMQFLQQSAGKRFEGVWAITDTNSFVKLNSNVVFGGNENFDLNNDTLHTNGYNLQVDEMGFYDGTIISDDTIYIKNKTKIWSYVSFIGNIKLTGVFNYSDGNVFIGTLTNQDTLINRVSNVLTIKGNIINNGYVLRDPSDYSNVIDVKGNIENNGIWKPYKTTLSGVNMQFLQQSAGKQFEGVWAITDTNSYVKLNSNVVFGGNENFDLNNDTLHTNGYNLQVDEMGFYDGTIISDDTIYIKNKTKIWSYVSFIGNIKLTGVFNYSDGNVFIGTLTNQDTLINRVSNVLTIKGNIINNGYVLRDPSNYYNEIDVKGNIENNGIWKPYKTTLSGVNMQFLQQSAGKQFEGVWAITDTNSYVQLMSEVKFFNADVNFGYDTLHTNSYKFEISNSDFYNASIITSDTITINNKNFSLKNVNFIGNAILKGSTYYSNNIVFENDLTILDTLMDRAGSFVITVKGSLNILGSFIRHPSNYYPDLYAYGNILLNGNFTVFQTYLVGKNTRTINGNFASSSTSKFIVDDSVSLHGNNIIPILSVSAKPEATLTILPQGFLELSSGISESKVFNYGKITSIQEIDTTTESNFNLYYASFRNYKNRFVNKLLIDHFGNQQHPTVTGSVNEWWRLRNNPQLFNDSLKYLKLRYTNQILNGNIPDSLQVYYSSNAGVKWNKITNNVLIDTATKTVTINNAPSAGHYVLSSTSLGILNFAQKLEHAEPRSGGNSGIVTMYIFGAGFKSSSVAKLTRSGYADITADTTYITDLTGESMLARFNLKNAELGKWDIVVNTPNDTTVSLPQYFTIEPGTRSNPWMTISGRDKFLLNRWQTFTISYGNTANTDAKGTVMVLTMNDIPGLEVAFPDINFVMPKGVLEENPWYKQIIDSVPLYYITDTLSEHLGERMRVYPFYLPYINAGSTNSVRVRVKLTGTGDLNFNAWIQDPWFESIAQLGKTSGPMPMEVRACITAAAMKYYATNLVSMIPIPGFGCFNLVDKIADPIGYITPESIKPEEVKPNTWGSSLWNMVSWAGSITQCATSIIPGVGAAINIGVGLTTMLIDSKDNYDTHQACWNKFKKDKKNKLKSKGVNSFDPNEIVGPQGYTELNYINKNSSLDYTVYFENKSTAGAAALEVFVFDTLDKTKFDLSTFSFGNISFGDTSVSVQNFAKEFSMLVDLSPKKDVIVNIQGKLDTATGIVTWSFHSLDRITLDLTEDPELGFLPPNVVSPQGEGNVKYTCALFQDVLHNVSVANQATIIFDFNAPITTNTHIATIDDREPISKVNTLKTVQEDSIFTVNWSGTDEGSGIAYYTIFVSENDSAFKVWKATTSLTSALFTGKDNAKYKFYCVATDSVGHVENKYNLTEATTTVKVVHSSVSSVSSNDKGFKLYPNPADNKVYVVMHLTENTSIDAYITDITGKTIQLIQGFNGLKGLNELTFNTEEFKKGIYFITIKTPQYNRTQKLIILK